MARHAELQTVDANQTVFSQGFGPSVFIFSSISLCSFTSLMLSVLEHDFLGDVGGHMFYIVLQGSVAIKVNNRIVKVRYSLRLFAPLTALIIDPSFLVTALSYPAPLGRRFATRLHSASLRCSANVNALPRLVRATQ